MKFKIIKKSLFKNTNKNIKSIFYFFIVALFIFCVGKVYASSTLGTIDPNNAGHYKAQVENADLGANTTINFGKFTTNASKNITVSNTELRGYAWGDGVGWIVMNCADTTSGCTVNNNNFKVANNVNGNLSGYAWGENTGWINFGPFTNGSISTVKITDGLFGGTTGNAGYAWAQNFGWIKFDCSNASSCVETDWGVTDDDDDGGGGSGGSTDVCPNITGNQSTVPNGKIIDGTGACVDNICPNTINYDSIPVAGSDPITLNIPYASTLGFGLKTYDRLDPSHTAGNFATLNTLNPSNVDSVVTFNPSTNRYVLGFEDVPIGGDNDFNDLVVKIDLSCSTAGSPCPAPSTLSDNSLDDVRESGEKTLQAILTDAGFNLNVDSSQKQYQVWNIPVNTTVTVTANMLAKFAGHSFVFGYYTNGSMTNFVPIFKTDDINGATNVPAACIPNPSDYCPNIDGIQSSMPPGMALNTAGECVNIVPDVCSNIPGSQLIIPAGDKYDENGNCVPDNIVVPTGSIKISSYICPTRPSLSRQVNGPDAQGNYQAPSSCTTLENSEFGSVYLPGKMDGGGGYPYINGEAIYEVLGKTNSLGVLLKDGLFTQGRYDIAETYNNGLHLPSDTRYGLFCYGDHGTWNDNLDYTFVPENGTTYCVSYRASDLCPNIAGTQQTVPQGSYIDNQNNCVTPPNPTDVCPNISGNQSTLPNGKILNTSGQCVDVEIPDACPNLAGYQSSVSSTMMYDEDGNCVPLNTQNDICPNISGNQTVVPDGMTLNTSGDCVTVTENDACPNIAGNQTSIPNGYMYDQSNNCVPIGEKDNSDLCPNIAGNQTVVPNGMTLNTSGDCVAVTENDACPNLAGNQATMPNGYIYDENGNCVVVGTPTPVDVCPNMSGNQSDVPAGMTIDNQGNCVTIDYCTLHPNSCTPPPDACTLDPSSCTPAVDFCKLHPASCTPPTDACSIDPQSCNSPIDFCKKHPASCTPPTDACSIDPSRCTPIESFCSNNPKACETNFVGKIYNAISKLKTLSPALTKFIEQNEGTATAVAVAGVTSLLVTDFSRLAQWFLWIFGFAKRKKWGTVYDSVTKYPLDPAYVTAHDMAGNKVAESITDLDGRYGFLLSPGSYTIVANKTNYEFPSKRLANLRIDEVYDDLYFGEVITISNREEVVLKNIPMDPIAYDWNEAEKHKEKLGKYSRGIELKRIFGILFYVGFTITLILFLVTFSSWNFAILCSYIVLFFLKPYAGSSGSSVIYKSNKQPVPHAIISIYTKKDDRKVGKRVTSPGGRFFALLSNGSYYLTVETQNSDGSYTLVHTSHVFKVRHGFVNEKIVI